MASMLKVLQQVGTTPGSAPGIGPVSRQELESFGLWRLLEPPPDDLPPAQAADGSAAALLNAMEGAVVAELQRDDRPRDCGADHRVGQPVSPRQSEYQELSERILSQVSPRASAVLVFAGIDEQSPAAAVVAELAVAVAARGAGEVLLVDADFHRPQLAGRFRVEAGQSLADVFLGVAPWEYVIRRTTTPQLSLLPGGPWQATQPLPQDFEPGRLLSQIQQSYRFVLVHAASMARAETVWLGRHAEGVYLVIELGRTPRRAAQQAVARLNRCGIRILGCILASTTR